jgi:hypothetical protein
MNVVATVIFRPKSGLSVLDNLEYITSNQIEDFIPDPINMDITQGQSANGDVATIGWDKATGFGLVQARSAISYLWSGYVPFIRDYREDIGRAPNTASTFYESPDLLIRQVFIANNCSQDLWGIVVKHKTDLTGKAYSGQTNYIYSRFQNRGKSTGTSIIYFLLVDLNVTTITLLGSVTNQKIKTGNFQVSDPLAWVAPIVTGNYYLLAVIDNLDSWLSINSIVSLEKYVLDNRFVACKKIEIITPSNVRVGRIKISAVGSLGKVAVEIDVNNDIYNEVDLVELEFLPPYNGPAPLKQKLKCSFVSQIGDIKLFKFEGQFFNEDPKNYNYLIKSIMLSKERLPVAEIQDWDITIQ